eukprot:CAMPEP_0201884606 /NCGR_PEP_ID=MMETSP0902-20130614/17454_1 /ASSEMBLY_ACC=CAM_ASM_000551 /TAXON_ID=420261 /ORGANISM="Thalassiosira antarctica, Strain CCMP982" /LENGTH=708 /DNA_ID=CAMNT_0048413599 /DNA_START=72 /DNA_END=2194 /DNA_ORIENTATION=+
MNPFDQFAGSLQAALPPQPSDNASVAPTVASHQQQQQQLQQQPQFSLMAQPTQEKKPVMNAPGMPPQQQQQGAQGMYGQQQQGMPPQGMYGQPPPQGMGQPPQGMYGQPPPQPQQQQQPPPGNQMMMMPSQSMMGGFGMGTSMPSVNGGVPPTPTGGMMAPPMQQLTNGGPNGGAPPNGAMAGALVPSNVQSNPYALGPAGAANPFGAPQQQQLGAPAPPPQQQIQQQNANPYGGQPGGYGAPPPQQQGYGAPPPQPGYGAPAPQIQQQQQQPPPQANPMMAMDPFSAPPPAQLAQPPVPQLAADPWGAPAPLPAQPPSTALVPSSAPPGSDPFGLFGSGFGGPPPAAALPPPQGYPSSGASIAPSVAPSMGSAIGAPPSIHPSAVPAAGPPQMPPTADDPWGDMGFGGPAPAQAAPSRPVPGEDDDLFNSSLQPTREEDKTARGSKPPAEEPKSSKQKRKKGELPAGGEWYDAKIFTPTLGVMFFKPKELVDSLFLQTDKKMVDQLEERPVVAFIVEGSSARSAGVELGHVLLKVNGIDVKNPKEASRLIKEGPRPLPLLFYVPETSVVVAEGEHMVKYNTKETGAPNSAKDWKPKYCVVGGIIAQPWMMNMYRSKSEYDIAVIETQARRPVSVKVKQFSLQGARIQNDWQGPQMVKYKNKLHPWKYIVMLPISRNPIKIASPNLSQLKPVHEGVRRVLMAQQRDRG